MILSRTSTQDKNRYEISIDCGSIAKTVFAEVAKVNDRGDLLFYDQTHLIDPVLSCAFAAGGWIKFHTAQAAKPYDDDGI